MTVIEIADNLAIGGLRNTADSVSRLHVVRDFGAKLGIALMELINKNSAEHLAKGKVKESWVSVALPVMPSAPLIHLAAHLRRPSKPSGP